MFDQIKKLFNIEILLFLLILYLAFLLRWYKISTLTTFGRDQGIDFLTVRQMIIEQKPTLLGIKVSLADFHQGPVYLYILAPFFYVFRFHPIAGAYSAISIALITLVSLYFTVRRFFGRLSAGLSALLFTVSPEFVREGNTPLYQHFVPLFIVVSLYFLLKIDTQTLKRNQIISALMLGIATGIACELHFLAVTFVTAVFLYLLAKYHQQLSKVFSFLFGLVIGISPTLAFELRHSFLNTQLFIKYLQTPHHSEQTSSVVKIISPWVEANTKWFGANNQLLGLIILGLFIFVLVSYFFSKKVPQLAKITLFTIAVGFLFSLKVNDFLAHYLLPTLTLQIILISVWVTKLALPQKTLGLVLFFVVLCLNLRNTTLSFTSNHGYSMPDGWNLSKIEQTASIISNDVGETDRVNVASLLDGDTRSYPLRYSLAVRNTKVDTVEQYPLCNILYVVSTKTASETQQSKVWEMTTTQPNKLDNSWDLHDGIYLYKFSRIPNNSNQML